MEELWLPVKGFEGLYEVSNFGRVKSHHKYGGVDNRIMKPKSDQDGYKIIKLSGNGKCKHAKVHRLVAEAFLDNPNGYSMINHKDENKGNNFVGNLEWCDAQYNNTFGHRLEKALPKTHMKWSKTDRGRKCMSYVGHSKGKRCACFNNEGIVRQYDSVSEAAKAVGEKPIYIAMCCTDNLKTMDGLSWKYI